MLATALLLAACRQGADLTVSRAAGGPVLLELVASDDAGIDDARVYPVGR